MKHLTKSQLINYLIDCIGYTSSDIEGSSTDTLIFLIGDNMSECIKYNS